MHLSENLLNNYKFIVEICCYILTCLSIHYFIEDLEYFSFSNLAIIIGGIEQKVIFFLNMYLYIKINNN